MPTVSRLSQHAISQARNYRADFGIVHRSSAIFALFADVRTRICFLNYWKIKNNVQVGLVLTVRNSGGHVVSRRSVQFGDASVFQESFEGISGSVEIEAYSGENLRIPYAAIMAVYETPRSISMVHSYARDHAPSEIEDGLAILPAREGCITLSREQGVRTLAYFQNGQASVPAQTATLVVRSGTHAPHSVPVPLERIAPYQTVCFDLTALAGTIVDPLEPMPVFCGLNFENRSSFPRLLVCWRDERTGEMQVTHSNFDYAQMPPDPVAGEREAWLHLPHLAPLVRNIELNVYPGLGEGRYSSCVNGRKQPLANGETISLLADRRNVVRITRHDGDIPSRIVTGLGGSIDAAHVGFECSFGVLHRKRPPKRFHWGLVGQGLESIVYFTAYPEIYDEPQSISIHFSLYGINGGQVSKILECQRGLRDLPDYLVVEEFFDNASQVLGGGLGYVTAYCEWGGLVLFTSMRKNNSITLEHSF